MPSESLPAKLLEIASSIRNDEIGPSEEYAKTIRAAAERIEALEAQAKAMYPLPAELVAMKAELARTRVALRCVAVKSTTQLQHPYCAACGAVWKDHEIESHNPVTINGVSGPCPAQRSEI